MKKSIIVLVAVNLVAAGLLAYYYNKIVMLEYDIQLTDIWGITYLIAIIFSVISSILALILQSKKWGIFGIVAILIVAIGTFLFDFLGSLAWQMN